MYYISYLSQYLCGNWKIESSKEQHLFETEIICNYVKVSFLRRVQNHCPSPSVILFYHQYPSSH